MAGSWGPKESSCRVGLFWDDVELSSDGSKARIVGGKIKLDTDVNVTDSSNTLTWTGGAVANGTKSNLAIRGIGSRTLANVTGEWTTLSSTKEVTANGSVVLAGLSGVGSDLKVTVTATYPKRRGSGTPLPPDGTNPQPPVVPNPWADENMPDVYSEQLIQHVYSVEIPSLVAPTNLVPAWDIEVDLDGGRNPYGLARFSAPLSYLLDPGMMAATSPFQNVRVVIKAGWTYGTTTNIHEVFSGLITGRQMTIEGESAFIAFSAESFETVYNYPSNLNKPVNQAHTKVSQFFTVTAIDLYRNTAWTDAQAGTPSPAELTEFRFLELEVGDDVGDFMRSLTNALSQWPRGSMTATVPTIEVMRDPYPYARLWELPMTMFSRLERTSGLDGWGNVLQLTTEWTAKDNGDTVSKRQTYASAEAASGTEAVRGADVTINVKPPGGTTPPTSWPTGLRWLRRTDVMSRAVYSVECRAVWWLQPRVDAIKLLANPLQEGPGAIAQLTFLVDQGLMTMSWAALNPPVATRYGGE